MERFLERSEFETFRFNAQTRIKGKAMKHRTETQTLTGDLTLKSRSAKVQFLDPNGADRTINLPPEEACKAVIFHFFNMADDEEDLIVKDDSGVVIITVSQNEGGLVGCSGTVWRGFVRANT